MDTRSDQPANDPPQRIPGQAVTPDFQYPLPSRPSVHKQDHVNLIALVIKYRDSWEIYIDERGIWVACGKTDSNCGERFEADTAAHLEAWIKPV